MRSHVFWTGLVGLVLSVPAGWVLLHLKPKRPAPVFQLRLADERLPSLGVLPPFALTDQDGQPFTLDRLKGHVSIVNFIFTTCPTACPMLSQKMSSLQQRTHGLGSAVQLVSFSVDPETDTPPVLKEYGSHYARDPARWTFVTGTVTAIESAVSDGFKIALTREKKPVPAGTPNGFDIVHGEQFVLVDGDAKIRGYYHKDDSDLDRLVHDAAGLAGKRLQESSIGQR